jgi:hypothetical protein
VHAYDRKPPFLGDFAATKFVFQLFRSIDTIDRLQAKAPAEGEKVHLNAGRAGPRPG